MTKLTNALAEQTGVISKLGSIFVALTELIVNAAQTKSDLAQAQSQRDTAIAKYEELLASEDVNAEIVIEANKALSALLDAATSAIVSTSTPSPEVTQVTEPFTE